MSRRSTQIEKRVIHAAKLGLTLTAAVCLTSTAAFATDLLGTQVSGFFEYEAINSGGVNLFDPANGYVPAGYGNSTGTSVTINSGTITFGLALPGMYPDTADFTATTLTVSEGPGEGLLVIPEIGWTMTFTDPAFAGITKTSDDFPNGGVATSISGDTITLQEGSLIFIPSGGEDTATFDIAVASAIPDSATTAGLLALGLAGLDALKRFKFFPR